MPNSVSRFVFPQQEPQFFTRISLREYSRPRPGDKPDLSMATLIRLPLPASLQDSFNIEVSNPALDLIGNSPTDLITAGKSKAEEFANMARQGNFSVSQVGQFVTQAAALAPGISDTGIGRLAQSVAGMVRNPHLTTIFEGVKLKTYNFSWKLSPKSASEAQRMNEMLLYIKQYMHPAIIAGGFALEYPYLATVEFVGPPAVTMPNVKDSFITGLTVNGAGAGAPAFFKDGQPVTVEFSLSFQEINIQTREDFGGSSSGRSIASRPTSGSERF